eukprot:TRINITY_DN2274_c0_g1_i4.p1 TRINITY_DN2274_c0_g1~~TRINITY_DN2274_c0_g1_i4.p1  ORF type:complete len:475 (-),score=83.69 TRINITY_DN2274_c0_g1_i4:316-1740(-)
MAAKWASLPQHMRNYKHANEFRAQVDPVQQHFPGLFPDATVYYAKQNPRPQNIVSLTGVVPISNKGKTYYIPVEIYLPETFPRAPPVLYLRPTPDMMYNEKNKMIQPDGQFTCPELENWNSSSNLVLLIQRVCAYFTELTPLVSKPAQKPPGPQQPYGQPPQQNMYPQGGYPPPQGPYGGPGPNPYGPTGQPNPAMAGAYGSGHYQPAPYSGHPPYGGYPPNYGPNYGGNYPPNPNGNTGGPGNPPPNYPQDPKAAVGQQAGPQYSSGYQAYSTDPATNPGGYRGAAMPPPPAPEPTPEELKQKHRDALKNTAKPMAESLMRQYQDRVKKCQDESMRVTHELRPLQEQLQLTGSSKKPLEDAVAQLRKKSELIDQRMQQNASLDGDELLSQMKMSDELSTQILNSRAAIFAIEDLLYQFDRLSTDGKVPFDQYIKATRQLYRDQYIQQMTLLKCEEEKRRVKSEQARAQGPGRA